MNLGNIIDFSTLDVTEFGGGGATSTWTPDANKKKAVWSVSLPASAVCGTGSVYAYRTLYFRSLSCAKYKLTIAGQGCTHETSPTITVTRRRGFAVPYTTTELLKARSANDGSPSTPAASRCSSTTSLVPVSPHTDITDVEVSLVCGDLVTFDVLASFLNCAACAVTVTIELVEP